MKTKLILSVDQKVIKKAKNYAQKKGQSLSDLIGNYLKSLDNKSNRETEISPRVKRLRGAIKLPKDLDYKKALEAELAKA